MPIQIFSEYIYLENNIQIIFLENPSGRTFEKL